MNAEEIPQPQNEVKLTFLKRARATAVSALRPADIWLYRLTIAALRILGAVLPSALVPKVPDQPERPAPQSAWAVLLVVIAGVGFWSVYATQSKAAAPARAEKGRRPAPDFALSDADGRTVRLADFKGKVVLLDFWATWCGPCKIEIPWFMEFQRKYKDQGFSVLGVSMDEGGWPTVRPFVEEMKMNYPVLLGNDETATAFGGIEVLPTTFIIDKQGRVVTTHMGLVSKDEMEETIRSLL